MHPIKQTILFLKLITLNNFSEAIVFSLLISVITLHLFLLNPLSITTLILFSFFLCLFLIIKDTHYKKNHQLKPEYLNLEQLPCATATLNQKGHVLTQNEAFDHLFSTKTKHPCWKNNQQKIAKTLLETNTNNPPFPQLNLENISKKTKTFYLPFYRLQKNLYFVLFIPTSKQLHISDWYDDWKKCLAHEVYTPLSSIQGFSQLLEKQHPDNYQFTQIITQQTHRLIASMNRFINQQPQPDRKIESCELVKLLEKHINHTKPLFKRAIPKIKCNQTSINLTTYKDTLELFLSQIILDCAKDHLQTTCIELHTVKEKVTIECQCKTLPFHLPIYQDIITTLNGTLTLEHLNSYYNLKICLSAIIVNEESLINT